MKTSTSIEEQVERKQARDNRDDGQTSPELRQPVRQKGKWGDASRIKAWQYKPGQSVNPGGVPKHDVSKEIAQAIFLNNPEMIYKAYCRMMRRGNAYCFQVLAERAWGKLKERHDIEIGPYRDLSDEDLQKQIADLERKLGIPSSTPELLPPADESSDSKPN